MKDKDIDKQLKRVQDIHNCILDAASAFGMVIGVLVFLKHLNKTSECDFSDVIQSHFDEANKLLKTTIKSIEAIQSENDEQTIH